MANVSKITINGNPVNLKDLQAREMLDGKQKKFTAGEGINISEDGTISCISSINNLPVIDVIEHNDNSGHYYIWSDNKWLDGYYFYFTPVKQYISSSSDCRFSNIDSFLYAKLPNDEYIKIAKLELTE